MRAAQTAETLTWHVGEDALDGSSRKVSVLWTRGGLVTRFVEMDLVEIESEIAQREAAGLDAAEFRKARSRLLKTVRCHYV